MTKSKKTPSLFFKTRLLAWWILIIVSLVFALIIAPHFSDYYVTQGTVDGSMFPLKSTDTPQQLQDTPTVNSINVYVSASSSMAGFVHQSRSGCVPSAYRSLLESLSETLNGYANVNIFYRSNIHAVDNLQAVVDESVYNAAVTNESGLEDVLRAAITNSEPSIIFTDLEGDDGQDFYQSVKSLSDQLFRAGKSLSIGRYVSAFSGVLYNYAESGKDYSYGLSDKQSGTTLLRPSSNYLHHQPRAFYVLIIADTENCERYQTSIDKAYWAFCSTLTQAAIQDHSSENLELYKAAKSILLPVMRAGTKNVHSAGVQAKTSTLWESGSASTADTNREVPQYTIKRTTDAAASCQLVYSIVPELSINNGASALASNIRVEMSTQSAVAAYKVLEGSYDESLPPNYLIGRGNHVIIYTLEDDQQATQYIETDCSIGTDGALQLTLNIQNGQLTGSLYRVYLKVYARQNGSQIISELDDSLSGYSITSSVATTRAAALERDRGYGTTPNPVLSTINLTNFLQAIHSGYITGASSDELFVADIVFDLKIEEE